MVAAEAARPFDLAADPLLRLRLLFQVAGEGEEKLVLFFNLHHIVSDGLQVAGACWSGASSAPCIAPSTRSGEAPGHLPPELPIQYADYARLAARLSWPKASALERQPRLLGAPSAARRGAPHALDLPTDLSRRPPVTQTQLAAARGCVSRRADPGDATRAARTSAGGRGQTLFMTLLAGLGALLHLR